MSLISGQMDLNINTPIISFELTKDQRNIYVRAILSTLIDKYLIDRPRLARTIGMTPAHMSDFTRGARTLSNTTLDKIEEVVNDLYEPLIRGEIEMNQRFIHDLMRRTEEETENSYKRVFKAGLR